MEAIRIYIVLAITKKAMVVQKTMKIKIKVGISAIAVQCHYICQLLLGIQLQLLGIF